MAVRASAAPADGKRPAPLVTVMVDYPTLAGRVCQLGGKGTVVAPGDIIELLGRDETLIERVVFDGANRVRDISTARTFRGTLRRVLDATHPRCEHETCLVPAKDCLGDHIVPWSDGGETSQDNGRVGCGFHNRLWYRNPHLRPPQRRHDLHPWHDEPPASHLAHDPPCGDPAHDPPRDSATRDDPPVAPSTPGADIVDRARTGRSRMRPARPWGPDLVVSDGETSYLITLAA